MTPLAVRVQAEYREMPGLRLTVRQTARLFGVTPDVADAVLRELRRASILARSDDGVFALIAEPRRDDTGAVGKRGNIWTDDMSEEIDTGTMGERSLRVASLDRLVCLLRHWTWADEAMARFERELGDGWNYDDDPMSDHPFGAYYHWCALLCAFGEAALHHGLLSPSQLGPIRQDIETSSPGLRACRQLLVVIPASLKGHRRIVDLIRDSDTQARLRRVHEAFGEALRKEQVSREIDSLDP